MKTASSLADLRNKHSIDSAVLACGVFDGVHRGHQQIVQELRAIADKQNVPAVVLTFEPHPRAVLELDLGPPRLTDTNQKIELLHHYGADAVVVLDFSEHLANLDANAFLNEYLLAPGFTIKGICIGEDWRFGKNAKGDIEFLRHQGDKHNFLVKAVPAVHCQQQPISSTKIRELILKGELSSVETMLGRPYAVRGKVIKGKQVGGTHLSCPTANLTITELLLPPAGVYAGTGRILTEHSREQNQPRPGIIYVGNAPTIKTDADREQAVEFHFFNLNDNLYNQYIEIEFYNFIREEKTFASADDLSQQIKTDIRHAEQALSKRHSQTDNFYSKNKNRIQK